MMLVERLFVRLGGVVARHPLPFVALPLLATTLSLAGLTRYHDANDIWDLYCPDDAASRVERAQLLPFVHASGANHYRIQILATPKARHSLANSASLERIASFNDYIRRNLTVTIGSSKEYHYEDMCGSFCDKSNLQLLNTLYTAVQRPDDPNIQLTYPVSSVLGEHVFLGYSVGQTLLDDRGNLRDYSLIILHYAVVSASRFGDSLAAAFEQQVRRLIEQSTGGDVLFSLYSARVDLAEQQEVPVRALPMLALTAGALGFFAMATTFRLPLVRSQHVQILFGILSPAMACVTTVGLLWTVGFASSNILTAVPFLVLVIGIDDAFLILAAWRAVDRRLSVERRLGTALAHAGTSITVTSLTDVLCFAIGTLSHMPVVRLFCVYASTALLIDFLYQLTFFAAVVAIGGRRDSTAAVAPLPDAVQTPADSPPTRFGYLTLLLRTQRLTGIGRVSPSSSQRSLKQTSAADTPVVSETASCDGSPPPAADRQTAIGAHLDRFVTRVLQNSVFRTVVFVLYAVYISSSFYFCTSIPAGFTLDKLYMRDSHFSTVTRTLQFFFFRESYCVDFATAGMPDLADERERATFFNMIERLESIPDFATGAAGTRLWLRDYQDFLVFWDEAADADAWQPQRVAANWAAADLDRKWLLTERSTGLPTRFSWTMSYHNMSSFDDVIAQLRARRRILADYPQFGVVSHHVLDTAADVTIAIPEKLMQTTGVAVLLMALLVLVFVRNPRASFWVIFSLFSIVLGTIGYLGAWGVDLNGISLLSILLCAGVSVDYSTHLSYHFFTALKQAAPTTDARGGQALLCGQLVRTYRAVGWPVAQALLSTGVGIVPLALVPSYVIEVFLKSVLLVTALAACHSLVLLPTAFVTFTSVPVARQPTRNPSV